MPANDPITGFRWPVSGEHTIGVPASALWEVMAQPGNLELCHPFCAANPVRVWPGPGARDEIHYLGGRVFERRFSRWLEGVGYDLEVGASGGRTSFVSWRISPLDDERCTLGITICPHVLQGLPAAIRWLPHVAYLRPMLQRYLASVLRGFEWYLIRGEPVPRNEFGTHPWFSAPG